MDIHIDWLSWTWEAAEVPHDAMDLYLLAKKLMRSNANGYDKTVFNGMGFEPSAPRAPYRIAILREDHGCKIYGNSHTGTVLYELSGSGCEALRQTEQAQGLLGMVGSRTTRIDLACDVRTGTRPAVFANDRSHQHFRTVGYVRSDSGETCYIGSTKSDRYCRVYRYDPPHPRSETLRVEYVFRRGLAAATAEVLCNSKSFADVAAQLGNTFGWSHKDWQPGIETDERMRVPIVTREDENTLRWVYAQCLPAMRRLMASGALDMQDFIDQLYDGIDET